MSTFTGNMFLLARLINTEMIIVLRSETTFTVCCLARGMQHSIVQMIPQVPVLIEYMKSVAKAWG